MKKKEIKFRKCGGCGIIHRIGENPTINIKKPLTIDPTYSKIIVDESYQRKWDIKDSIKTTYINNITKEKFNKIKSILDLENIKLLEYSDPNKHKKIYYHLTIQDNEGKPKIHFITIKKRQLKKIKKILIDVENSDLEIVLFKQWLEVWYS